MMREDAIASLTSKNDTFACALAEQIANESRESDRWYAHFDDFAALLNHPKSYVRNRAMHILAANARWDAEGRFDAVLPDFLAHIADEKPITARQYIRALAQLGRATPRYAPQIRAALRCADLSKYADSMRPLIERDIAEAEALLSDCDRT